MALVRQGWPAAFEAVYDRHHRGMLSFCRHVLGDADEAEDAVQHTFLAAYNDLIASDKPIHLRAWLFTIARNRCYSILRARREQPAADLDEPVTEGLATQVQRRQDLRDLVADLRGLPDEQRAALVLAELDALSHEQIGEALGVPRAKVKALVFQARESLVASRTARETACADIREQLSAGRGGTLRRANLRRHLRECSGCRDFRRQIERQRRQMAAVLPVIPTLALKDTILTGAACPSASFTGGGLLASSALKSGLLKGVATLMLAGAGTAGTFVATHDFHVRSIFGNAAPRHHAPAQAASVSGADPAVHRAAALASSSGRAEASVAASAGRTDTVRPDPRTTSTGSRSGILDPFGPLVHQRMKFPRAPGPSVTTIAPPASTGKPATVTTASVVPGAASPPSVSPVLVTPSSNGSHPAGTGHHPAGGDARGVSTGGSGGGARSMGGSRGAGSATGSGRVSIGGQNRGATGRPTNPSTSGRHTRGGVSRAGPGPGSGSSDRASGSPSSRPATGGGTDRGTTRGGTTGNLTDSSSSGVAGSTTVPGGSSSGSTTDPGVTGTGTGTGAGTGTGGSGGNPSGGAGGRGGTSGGSGGSTDGSPSGGGGR